MANIYPVILCGGEGVRLWPMSRRELPKQFLPLTDEASLLQHTVRRLDGAAFQKPIAICQRDHRFLVASQLAACGVTSVDIVAEPHGRGTAAAAVVASLLLAERDPAAILLLTPSDHDIGDAAAFNEAAMEAAGLIAGGGIATFGITPSGPETGYGYIRRGARLGNAGSGFEVAAFVEKPDRGTAERYVVDGGYYWNSGIFVFAAARFLAEARRHAPDIVAACEAAVATGVEQGGVVGFDADTYRAIPKDSIDCAVMEKTRNAIVIATDMDWSDVGVWSALWRRGAKDDSGNVIVGDAVAVGARNCYLRGEGKMVAAVGVENLIVVSTKDAVLAVPRDKAQEVRNLVAELECRERAEAATPSRVHRPWGCFEELQQGNGFRVKMLEVEAGARISYQTHGKRNEHWIVVQGVARVTLDGETILVEENQSVYIPAGAKHRVENPGDVILKIVEVQTGCYFGEDDIIRFEDAYGRPLGNAKVSAAGD